ncbi:MAG: hypothetical protein IJT72_02650 [Lachnospiraceae bacterium]|nr:hypothetical protein [Lachnospiraceae bacterium]
MSLNQSKKLNIDTRTKEDIMNEVVRLAGNYDTGWAPDEENPDIGSALANVFAQEVAENIDRMNEIMDRYHTEFVNMLDISLLPAKPASSIVVCELSDDTIPGAGIPKGTKLLTDSDEPVVFETEHGLYVTSATLSSAFMADRETGAIVPLLGSFRNPELIPGEELLSAYTNTTGASSREELKSFTLFGESGGIDRNVVVFYHPTVFDCENDDIYVRIEGGEELVNDIKEKRVRFAYLTNDGIKDYTYRELRDDNKTFVLRKYEPNRKINAGTELYSMLLMVADRAPVESRHVKSIMFSAHGRPVAAENINNGSNDFDTDDFAPFTDTISVYDDCYICHDNYFSKAGARVKITFDLSISEHKVSLTAEQVQESLKVIKRKPKTTTQEIPGNCYVEEFALEYFNGTGWKKLPTDTDHRGMFSNDDKAGKCEISFICPDDWVEQTTGPYEGRCIRMQVVKAENCYMRPCIHHFPTIKNLLVSYTYENQYVHAERAETIIGTSRKEITSKLKSEDGYMTFLSGSYTEDALYLGFSKPMESGPVSILFNLSDSMQYEGLKCRFEYVSPDGFKPMKVLDYTQEFTHSGVIMFIPPADMRPLVLEGRNAYWIRVVRIGINNEEKFENLPFVDSICLNAVQVSNIETRPTQSFFVEEIRPGMQFYLGVTHILDVDVWVNEMGRHSRERMMTMLEEEPENVIMEQDTMGGITAFYRRWYETDRLETADNPRSYQLDRLLNRIIFGDGIRTWLPSVTDDEAIRCTVRCCNGREGNVDINRITEPQGYLMYIGSITNPIKAYGGSNIEDLDKALGRGASELSSRRRLVTMKDYTRAIYAYSDTIDQVKGIIGQTKNGDGKPGDLTFVLLMKDYMEGSYSFHRIVGGLTNYLLSRSEITVTEKYLHVVEPTFVELSVSVWINVINIDDSFEIQALMQQALSEYLNPVESPGLTIGILPRRSQLLMRLNSLKNKAIVKKSVVIAKYRDEKGIHEMDLEDVKVTPFMVAKNGEHKVHILN